MDIDPTIAVTNEAFASLDDLLAFCGRHGCRAVEYSFDRKALAPEQIRRELPAIRRLQGLGFALRCHLAFQGAELALANAAGARKALDLFRFSLDQAAELGIRTATMHIGLGRATARGLDYRIAVDNLGALAEHGRKRGIRVCLENLRRGWTSDPQTFGALLEESGAWATLDLGHATAREHESRTPGLARDFLSRVGKRVAGAHVYEIETVDPATGKARHQAPHDLASIAPLLDGLRTSTPCDWWLIELHDPGAVAATLPLVRSFLGS